MSKEAAASYLPITVILMLVVSAWFSSVGFLASDDASYAATAMNWNESFPFVGDSHWSLRQTLVLPLAAVFALMGPSEAALVGVSTFYFILLMGLCYWWLAKNVPGHAKTWFLLLAAVAPGFIFLAGTSNVDVTETFYFVASLMLFHKAKDHKRQLSLLFVAGLMVGLAFLSRATAVSLIVTYSLFFIMGIYHSRKAYFALGAGAALVFGMDWLFYLVQTGDPLYRLNVLVHSHLGVGNPDAVRIAEGTGNLAVGTRWEPILMLLINNEFGLVFYAAAAMWLWARRKQVSIDGQPLIALLFWASVIHFIVIGYLMGLRPLPRYYSFLFMPALFYLSVVAAASFASQVAVFRRVAAGVFLLLAASGFLMMDLSNKEPRFQAVALLSLKTDRPDAKVWADPEVCRRASAFVALRPAINYGSTLCSPPEDAEYFLVSDERTLRAVLSPFHIEGDLMLKSRIEASKTLIGTILTWVGYDHSWPIPRRVISANPDLQLWQFVVS